MNKQTISQNAEEKFVLEMTRELPVVPEKVFAAFSNFEAMSAWFGPHGCKVNDGELNFVEGGSYRMQIPSEKGGNNAVGGIYKEIDPPSRIVFSWKWEPREEISSDEMEITIEFREIEGGKTELSLRQILVPEQDVAEHHSWGWAETFERLGAFLGEE